jgi:hypothetical protein
MREISLKGRAGFVAVAALGGTLALATPAAAADYVAPSPPGCRGASTRRRAWLRRGRASGAGAGLSAVRRRRALLVRPALLARLLGPPVRGMVRAALGLAPLLADAAILASFANANVSLS